MYLTHIQERFFVSGKKPEYIAGFDYFEFDPEEKELKTEDVISLDRSTNTLVTQKGDFQLTECQVHLLESNNIETMANQEITITTDLNDEIVIEPPRKSGRKKIVTQLSAGNHTLSFAKPGGYKIYSNNYISNNLCITVRKPTTTSQNFVSIR